MHLIVTSRARIEAVYGTGTFQSLDPALKRYAAAAGLSSAILIVDDAMSAAAAGIDPVVDADGRSIAAAVRGARRAATADPVRSLLLVGGPESLPHFQFTSSIPGDPDVGMASDNPYGCKTADSSTFVAPGVAIGRIAAPARGGIEALVANLDAQTELHLSPPGRSGAWALGCLVWDEFTGAVATSMGAGPIRRVSPNYTVNGGSAGELRTRFVYFNLHGALSEAPWFGADLQTLYPAADPAGIGAADLRGAVVFAANCFGAAVEGRSVDQSCALTAAAAGARAFIGSTATSFGAGSSSHDGPQFSDRLAQLFFGRCLNGETAGMALRNARIDYVRESLSNGLIFERDRKTALEFILLGDPTL